MLPFVSRFNVCFSSALPNVSISIYQVKIVKQNGHILSCSLGIPIVLFLYQYFFVTSTTFCGN